MRLWGKGPITAALLARGDLPDQPARRGLADDDNDERDKQKKDPQETVQRTATLEADARRI